MNLDFKQFSRRHRPHIHKPDATLFVTYRLAGSIPQSTVRLYKAKKDWLKKAIEQSRKSGASDLSEWLARVEEFAREWFLRFEKILYQAKVGPMWMQDPRVADQVAESLHRLDNDAYRLDAYSVMSNHVHTVFHPLL
ncbi:MAG TPA: hypothetical protein VFH31_13155 [Pyrinomonadaceae bacterium]|nr:hypothetical protein [Pyrinomonadaceae bacterium]